MSENSISYHAKNHLSRQLCQVYEKRQVVESLGLLSQLEDIIGKAQLIFDRNFKAKRDGTALKALGEQRNTLDLLCRIAAMFHEARLAELRGKTEDIEARIRQEIQAEQSVYSAERLARLSDAELEVLAILHSKMAGDITGLVFDFCGGNIPTIVFEPWQPQEKFVRVEPEESAEQVVEHDVPPEGPEPALDPEPAPDPEPNPDMTLPTVEIPSDRGKGRWWRKPWE
ncbi:MAG: hypothetical protein PHW74_00320 [Desulfobacca sp.]|nr:hypothetical protein [Desulfobacca sp.]